MRLAGWLALSLVAGCDGGAVSAAPCTVLCGEAESCPGGMVCGADGFCHDDGDDADCSAAEPADAPPRESPPDAAAPAPDATVLCQGGDLSAVYDANGHCYMFFAAPATWGAAQTLCLALDSHLVTVGDGWENSFLKNTFVGTRVVFVGGWDGMSEGSWRWVTDEPWAFSAWKAGEPNNSGDEDCATMAGNVGEVWDDKPCGHAYSYLCEREY
jgi:hypothetical protein